MRFVFMLLAGLLLAISARAFAMPGFDPTPWTKDEVRALMHRVADGDAEALFLVGRAMLRGDRLEKDEENGLRYLKQAAEKNHAPSLLHLSWWYGGKDTDLAYRYLERAVRNGDPEANYRLGQNLMAGSWSGQTNYTYDQREARIHELFLHAAERGHSEAMYEMGLLYLSGRGVEADTARAVDWLTKASSNPRAHEMLALLFKRGERVPRDIPRAIEHYRKALELAETIEDVHGHPNDPARLHVQIAELLELSQGAPNVVAGHYAAARDDENAVDQTRMLAAMRLARVIADYGQAHQVRDAIAFLETQANQGYLPAMCFLAVAAHYGRTGIPPDMERFKSWEARLLEQMFERGKVPAKCKEMADAECQAERDEAAAEICGELYPEPLK